MTANLRRMARRILLAASMGWSLSLAAAMVQSQDVPPPAPDASKGTTDDAKGAGESAKDAAEASKGPADAAKDAAKAGDKDASDPFAEPATDAARGSQEGARETTRELREGARDAGREAREGARDVREGTRESARDLREGARDAGREAREGASDESRDLREGARDTTRDLREGAQDANREAREGIRDIREGEREDGRDLREGARDSREDARDLRERSRESFRDDDPRPRQDTDPRDARREFRDDRSESRESSERLRAERDDFRDADSRRDSFRESSRTDSRSETRFRTENLRAADLGIWFSRSTSQGLTISDVATTGPMASVISSIGFREGDQIVSVDGYRVTRDADFIRYLLADEVLYERVPIVVMRGGRRTTLHVEPIRLVEHVQTVHHDPLEQFGIILDDRSTDRVLVWRVIPRSPAFYAGIQPGDVITTFHGQRVTSPDAFLQIVERAEPGLIALEVNRNQRVRQLDVDFPQLEAATAPRAAFRPDFDDPNVERLSERREDRIEDRREMRLDGNDGYDVPPVNAPSPGPVRRALFPRLRGR